MSRILVTGGCGFIGSHLVERLVEEEHYVYVIDDESNATKENIELVGKHATRLLFRDVNDYPYDLEHGRERVEYIFHLVCFPRSLSFEFPEKSVMVNLMSTVKMLRLARMTEAKIIFSSNSGIHSTKRMPVFESTPFNPTSPYDVDKLASENHIRLSHQLYGLTYTILRFGSVYGPSQGWSEGWKPVVVEFMKHTLADTSPTIYGGDQTRAFIYVGDVVSALVKAMDRCNNQAMILGTGRETSIDELWEKIAELTGTKAEPKREPMKEGDILRREYPSTKARNRLGWRPMTSLDDGLRSVMEWLTGKD